MNSNIHDNMKMIEKAILLAANNNVRLLVFPECSLTGYPPITIESCECIDFIQVEECFYKLQKLSIKYNMFIIIGSVTKENEEYYNSAITFSPDGCKIPSYDKRALWGWDKENFSNGESIGVIEIDNIKVGIRICFEVRFPEYFRELYKLDTDLNLVIFYDVSNDDDIERYELIKSHLKTRAVENVTEIVSVNTINKYQTAPTAIFDKSGKMIMELLRDTEGLLVYDFQCTKLSFSEEGRKIISDNILKSQ